MIRVYECLQRPFLTFSLHYVGDMEKKFNTLSHHLIIFEGYHNDEAWFKLHLTHQSFQPICLFPEAKPPFFYRFSVPDVLPFLKNTTISDQLSEYAAFFAIAKAPPRSQWIGFQSYRAWEKGSGLNDSSASIVDFALKKDPRFLRPPVFLYWGIGSNDIPIEMALGHGQGMLLAFGGAFRLLFYSNEEIDINSENLSRDLPLPEYKSFIPSLPVHPTHWSYMSQFIMDRESLKKYAEFSRKFFIALESQWHTFQNMENCPIQFLKLEDVGHYKKNRCWGYVLERLVSYWVYYTKIPMFYVHLQSGNITEYLPLDLRKHSLVFSEESLEILEKTFISRLSCDSLELYVGLGGTGYKEDC